MSVVLIFSNRTWSWQMLARNLFLQRNVHHTFGWRFSHKFFSLEVLWALNKSDSCARQSCVNCLFKTSLKKKTSNNLPIWARRVVVTWTPTKRTNTSSVIESLFGNGARNSGLHVRRLIRLPSNYLNTANGLIIHKFLETVYDVM